jgi:ankyrin repeat protein
LLAQHNASVNATTTDIFKHTPLHLASAKGRADVAEILLEHGACIDALSKLGTPLFRAVDNGHFDVARLLLKRGADPQIQGIHNLTPFQVATQKGHTQIAQLLLGLEHGADNN